MKTILIIDDDLDYVHRVAQLLHAAGFECMYNDSADEVLSGIEKLVAVDAVILDIMMMLGPHLKQLVGQHPAEAGEILYAAISKKWPHTPVIIVTAKEPEEVRANLHAQKPLTIISKPLTERAQRQLINSL